MQITTNFTAPISLQPGRCLWGHEGWQITKSFTAPISLHSDCRQHYTPSCTHVPCYLSERIPADSHPCSFSQSHKCYITRKARRVVSPILNFIIGDYIRNNNRACIFQHCHTEQLQNSLSRLKPTETTWTMSLSMPPLFRTSRP